MQEWLGAYQIAGRQTAISKDHREQNRTATSKQSSDNISKGRSEGFHRKEVPRDQGIRFKLQEDLWDGTAVDSQMLLQAGSHQWQAREDARRKQRDHRQVGRILLGAI